jgi:hypothetical protein
MTEFYYTRKNIVIFKPILKIIQHSILKIQDFETGRRLSILRSSLLRRMGAKASPRQGRLLGVFND